MPRLSLRLPPGQTATLIGGSLLFSASLFAAVFAAPAPSAETPQQVAETLDSIVQPRFQKDIGQFGTGRVTHNVIPGHEGIEWIGADNRFETRRFATLKASHRSYILAFLHCRHKPGAPVDPSPKPQLGDDFKSYTEPLIAFGATEDSAQRMYDWADKSLNPVVLPHLTALKQGHSAQAEYENWVIVMRPVRALHQSCITCHAGTRRGDTLGVMVYVVDKKRKIKGEGQLAPGGE